MLELFSLSCLFYLRPEVVESVISQMLFLLVFSITDSDMHEYTLLKYSVLIIQLPVSSWQDIILLQDTYLVGM